MRMEVTRVAQGLISVLSEREGFEGLQVLTKPETGEGFIISFWQTEADAEASEANSSYIGQMSMISSYLYEPLEPETYEVSIRA
jgi:heme-degrading monooxygenase HmoA